MIFTAAAAVVATSACLLAGCGEAVPKDASVASDQAELPSTVKAAPVETAAVEPYEGARRIEGFATVLPPDPLVQIDGDIRTAEIAVKFSKGQIERFRETKSLAAQTVANAERQADADEAQLKLLNLKLEQSWGAQAPFMTPQARAKIISDLSSGKSSIVRLDFPLALEKPPVNVKVSALQGGEARAVSTMWDAPSGSQAIPGISFFALVDSAPGLRAGDRGRVSAERSEALAGALVPASAVVVSGGQTWAYVETAAKTYERRPVSLEFPVNEAFLVHDGFPAGTKVVVRGASVLLAREAGPGALDDDDDAGGAAKEQPKSKQPATATPAGDDDDPKTPAAKPADSHPSNADATKDDGKKDDDARAPADAAAKPDAAPAGAHGESKDAVRSGNDSQDKKAETAKPSPANKQPAKAAADDDDDDAPANKGGGSKSKADKPAGRDPD